jgi:cytochrome c
MRYPSVFGASLAAALTFAPFAGGRAQDGDPEAGKRVFNQCSACHTINQGGPNRVGPNLHGVIGRKAAAVEGFRYSGPMKQKGEEGLVWTEEALRPYLKNPREVVAGTIMAFPGLRQDQQITDVIAYLKQQSGG